MRPIYLAQFGSKTRPVLVLTRAGQTIGLASKVTVAGITSTVHGLRTEVPVGPENGLNHGSVVNVADIQTIRQMDWAGMSATCSRAASRRSPPPSRPHSVWTCSHHRGWLGGPT